MNNPTIFQTSSPRIEMSHFSIFVNHSNAITQTHFNSKIFANNKNGELNLFIFKFQIRPSHIIHHRQQ